MTDLQEYVDVLFQHQPLTPEVKDLKEEILSNMMAKQEDLIARGLDPETAGERAKESLISVENLIDGNQLTDMGSYRLECMQTVLLSAVIGWIFTLPLLFTCYALLTYGGLALVLLSGFAYLRLKGRKDAGTGFLSVAAGEHRKKMVWLLWGLFFTVSAAVIGAVTFGSNLWFGRPVHITGPYELANIAVRFYLPLLTIMIPITYSSFPKILLKHRKGREDE